ncbi:MAG: hypothetical protein SOI44_09005 [Lactimicrobium sp.]|jgi:hypothetical protein|uniref:hypothetical protein n=1 Tax=Lactimicrobium sp. TaxID=2563780 RepID=UPI002F355F7A
MVRWAKICGNQYFGFWIAGILFFVLQEFPYLLMPLFHLETNPIMNMTETSATLDLLEKISGTACIVLMLFIVHKDASVFSASNSKDRLFFILAIVILLANYAGWALYFTGHQSISIMMIFLVALPPLYYTVIGMWRHNTPLTIVSLVFFIIHFVHVYGNLNG